MDLRIGPGIDSLDALLAEGRENTFDLAFIDADKKSYPDYYERCVRLVRPGGVVALDNVLWGGEIADLAKQDRDAGPAGGQRAGPDDARTEVLLPVADGMTSPEALSPRGGSRAPWPREADLAEPADVGERRIP